jgi:hypothetical protein
MPLPYAYKHTWRSNRSDASEAVKPVPVEAPSLLPPSPSLLPPSELLPPDERLLRLLCELATLRAPEAGRPSDRRPGWVGEGVRATGTPAEAEAKAAASAAAAAAAARRAAASAAFLRMPSDDPLNIALRGQLPT